AADRQTIPYVTRARAEANWDSRTQTAYGTLRTYMVMRLENADGASAAAVPRAFIQWAGFTFGRTKSQADVPGSPLGDSFRSLHQQQNVSDSGGGGAEIAAYNQEIDDRTSLGGGGSELITHVLDHRVDQLEQV